MKVIHLLRKPLSESTVAFKHGVAGLNIDECRISAPEALVRPPIPRTDNTVLGKGLGRGTQTEPGGRWPSNLILQHLDGCRCAGVKRVKGSPKPYVRDTEVKNRVYGKGAGLQEKGYQTTNYGDEDGKESVANWICAEGCPVKALDKQSGVLTSGTTLPHHRRNVPRMGHGGVYGDETPQETKGVYFAGDSGGASRFFKQIGGSHEGD